MNMDYVDALDAVLAQLSGGAALVGVIAEAVYCTPEEQTAAALYAVERLLRDTLAQLEKLVTEGERAAVPQAGRRNQNG